jgi:nitroimidazol reductase NimA-like FMN-containing flavoprotein (pyridoxamine 5'-phosphate oxidase superfamily)
MADFLTATVIPVRLACQDAHNRPLVTSLWYLYRDGELWCATQESARLVAMLRRNSAVGFEVAGDTPPYHGVRGQGQAELVAARGPDTLEQLIDRYLGRRDSGLAGWLLARRDTETAIRIRPDWMTAWDYRRRMQDAMAPAG